MSDDAKERIVAVAVRHKGLVVMLPQPARHADVLRPLFAITKEHVQADDQGFLTSSGRFVERREATRVAFAAGQIAVPRCGDLFSEDLW